MKVRVKLFAVARQLAGRDELELSLPAGATIGELRHALGEQSPELASLAQHAMFAVGTEYADDRTTIPENADLACIPPVSGG
ncbi:MAG: MoaD/ThiS family protein [Planctomycetia bacterium]|nr:MoaD/ThiS family protein [Planctomycetia bacterium]